GQTAETLGLTGEEVYSIEGLPAAIAGRFAGGRELLVTAERPGAPPLGFSVSVRIDTPQEMRYYENGGILPYVLRQLLAGGDSGGARVKLTGLCRARCFSPGRSRRPPRPASGQELDDHGASGNRRRANRQPG